MKRQEHPSTWSFSDQLLAHVTTVCYRKQRFFENLEVVRFLKHELQESSPEKGIKLLKIGVDFDHMHSLFCLESGQKVCNIMGYLKGLSSFKLRKKFEYLKEYPCFWAEGSHVKYYPLSRERVLMNYIHNQKQEQMMRDLGEDAWPWC